MICKWCTDEEEHDSNVCFELCYRIEENANRVKDGGCPMVVDRSIARALQEFKKKMRKVVP